jgi:hypothetical protein
MTVLGTDQACHVALAIGDEAPFFVHPGALPATGVVVEGLVRAANRYLLDTPTATAVPLRLSAAGPGRVVVSVFEATLAPEPPAPPRPAPPRPPEETVYLTPIPAATVDRAQLCDAGHSVAQGFAPLPAGRLLSSIGLYLRPGTDALAGTLSICADAAGIPAADPMDGGAIPLNAAGSATGAPGFATCRPAAPLALSQGPWWLVCELAQGEGLWFTAATRPVEAAATLARTLGGSWTPATAAPKGWAQTRLRTIAAPESP